jgi:thiol-disulfide isomerase/thioredoxin
MKRIIPWIIVTAVLLSAEPVLPAPQGPVVGGKLPDFTLTIPDNPALQAYLGLNGKTEFSIPDIPVEVVIIEIFSMYCPHCQREAPEVNRFFERLSADPVLSKKIKLIGIGAGNSAYEVEVFRKKYRIAFPLFEDGDFSIHKKIGEVRTPYFIGVKNNPDGSHAVFYSKLGGFESPEKFLGQILESSGIEKGGTP